MLWEETAGVLWVFSFNFDNPRTSIFHCDRQNPDLAFTRNDPYFPVCEDGGSEIIAIQTLAPENFAGCGFQAGCDPAVGDQKHVLEGQRSGHVRDVFLQTYSILGDWAGFEGGRMATSLLPRPPDPQEAKKSPWAKTGEDTLRKSNVSGPVSQRTLPVRPSTP